MSPDGSPNFDEYPERVELCFRTTAEKETFLAGLSDGFGENICTLNWPWQEIVRRPDGSVVGFSDQPRFAVELIREEEEQ